MEFTKIDELTLQDAEKELKFFTDFWDLYGDDQDVKERIKDLFDYIDFKKYIKSHCQP